MVRIPPVASQTPFTRIVFYLIIFIVVIYGNTLDAEWHLDDYPNILQNTHIQVDSLSPSTLWKAVHFPFTGGERISRPLAMLSFALNWYLHGAKLTGYHLVNIGLHAATTVLLYMTILLLLRDAPALKERWADSRQFIALLAAVLWAANPVQTQAVTYIVQRMAAMVAFFYILTLYFYLRGRTCPAGQQRWRWWLAAAGAFTAGMASKENAALLPFALILLEIVFFQDLGRAEVRRRWFWIAGIAAVAVVLGGSALFLNGDMSKIVKAYDERPFTLMERLVTQPRVLWLYISLLVYPVPSRLTPEYDLELSTGLLQPWTTLPAMGGLFLLAALGFFLMRRRPLASFAILFFLLNHALESSIIPLEMVFEHRNYLPSMFVFLPVAAAFKRLVDVYRERSRGMHAIVVGFGILVMMGWGMGTYIRNMAWATEETLWRDAVAKAPRSYRALHNLAWGYFERTGQVETAYRLYEKGRGLRIHNKNKAALPLNNMANIQYVIGEYEAAARLWQEALVYAPDYPDYIYRYALALTRTGDYDQAMRQVDRLIARGIYTSDAESLKGRLLLLQGDPERALTILQRVHRRNPRHPISSYRLGLTLLALGLYPQAEILLRRSLGLRPDDPKTILWLARVNYLADDQNDFQRFAEMLARRFTVKEIHSALRKSSAEAILRHSERAAADRAVLEWLGARFLVYDALEISAGKP